MTLWSAGKITIWKVRARVANDLKRRRGLYTCVPFFSLESVETHRHNSRHVTVAVKLEENMQIRYDIIDIMEVCVFFSLSVYVRACVCSLLSVRINIIKVLLFGFLWRRDFIWWWKLLWNIFAVTFWILFQGTHSPSPDFSTFQKYTEPFHVPNCASNVNVLHFCSFLFINSLKMDT